ncbi:hypothetical protein MNBD_GAMMA10-773 [hydrothermal vent metagenome]|uniref:Uncharacterized protein n=1 Tax=hydrothermal vent metagenome TaxID=652676 RepID=A0A3B0Y1D7_9ZZZZ
MSKYVSGREKFVEELFSKYKNINVNISDFRVIASKNKAQLNVVLDNLVDINDRKIIPGGWSRFQTTIAYNDKNQLKVIW